VSKCKFRNYFSPEMIKNKQCGKKLPFLQKKKNEKIAQLKNISFDFCCKINNIVRYVVNFTSIQIV